MESYKLATITKNFTFKCWLSSSYLLAIVIWWEYIQDMSNSNCKYINQA